MIYSREVEEMCPVAQGVHHGAAPIPEEAKWVQAKEVKDISGLTRAERPRRADVEATQRGQIEPHFPQVRPIVVAQVLRQRQRGLLGAIGKTTSLD